VSADPDRVEGVNPVNPSVRMAAPVGAWSMT